MLYIHVFAAGHKYKYKIWCITSACRWTSRSYTLLILLCAQSLKQMFVTFWFWFHGQQWEFVIWNVLSRNLVFFCSTVNGRYFSLLVCSLFFILYVLHQLFLGRKEKKKNANQHLNTIIKIIYVIFMFGMLWLVTNHRMSCQLRYYGQVLLSRENVIWIVHQETGPIVCMYVNWILNAMGYVVCLITSLMLWWYLVMREKQKVSCIHMCVHRHYC